MMKPVKRIFLILGAMSMFSLFQFDAMGDNTNKDCNSVDDGRYCWHKDDKSACPAGCYCKGGNGVVAVDKFYPNKTSFKKACALRTLASMSGAGVHLCPSGTTSNPAGGAHGAKISSDCFSGLTAWDGKQNCTTAAPKGKYCRHKDVLKEDCAPGCYCEGGGNAIGGNSENWGQVTSACKNHWSNGVKDYLEARGVKYCPNSFPNSVTKAESIDDCYFEEDNERRYYKDYKQGIEVDAGYYLPKSKTTPTSCENLTGLAVCLGGSLVPSAVSDVGITSCVNGKIPNSNRSDCVCPNGKVWVDDQNACVSRYAVTYNCNGGTGTAPTDSNSPYLVGAIVTVKSNTCTAQSGRTFDKWNCDKGIGDKTTNQTFSMPSENVTCKAKWKSAGNNGGGTQGGGSHSCQPGQYWSSGIDVRVDVRADTADVTNLQVGRSAKKAATKSVVSRAAMQPSPVSTFNGSMAKTLDAADLRSALGGSCTDCEVGYYCPGGTQGRVACPEGKYTNTTGQTQCLVCNGTVTQTGNLNTGCSTDPDNPGNNYNVTYNCGDHGTGDLSNNGASHTSGTQVTTLASTACARNEGYTFSNWECMAGSIELSVNNAGQFTMPNADVTCTAQWSTGSNGNGGGNGNENEDAVCPVGQYLPADGEDADDCEQCSGNYVCPGDDKSYLCPWTVSGNTCGGILNAEQLKKGKSLNSDCWKFFNSPSDYRECVYGFSID